MLSQSSLCFGAFAGLVAIGTTVVSSARTADPPPTAVAEDAPAADAAPTSLRQDRIRFRFTVSFESKPELQPLMELDRLLTESGSAAHRVEAINDKDPSIAVVATIGEPEKAASLLDPATPASSKKFVDPDDHLAVEHADAECVLEWGYPGPSTGEGLRSAVDITQLFAERVGGLIYDETTRQFFSVNKWRELRNMRWDEGVPNLGRHIIIHVGTRRNGFLAAVTHGMEKFGLPNPVVRQFPPSSERQITFMINLFAQAMAEDLITEVRHDVDLDLRRIHHRDVHESVLNALGNGSGTALLRLSVVRPTMVSNLRMLGILFDRGTGPDELSQQADLLAEAFGADGEISSIPDDAELQAASRKARAEFLKLRDRFHDGVPVGEDLHVKAPFETTAGDLEWRWVSVSSWNHDWITGSLTSDPQDVPDLSAGDIVEVNEEDVFDYVHTRLDGSCEGNTTGALIRSRKSLGASE